MVGEPKTLGSERSSVSRSHSLDTSISVQGKPGYSYKTVIFNNQEQTHHNVTCRQGLHIKPRVIGRRAPSGLRGPIWVPPRRQACKPTGPRLRTLVSYWADLWCLEHSSSETKTSVKRLGLHEGTIRTMNPGALGEVLAFTKEPYTLPIHNVPNCTLQQRKFLPNSKGKLSSELI